MRIPVIRTSKDGVLTVSTAAFQILMMFVLLLCGAGPAAGVMPSRDEQPRSFPEAQADGDSHAKEKFREGEVLVKFREDVTNDEMAQSHGRLGARVIRKHDRMRLHQVRLDEGKTVEKAVAEYLADLAVEYAEPDYVAEIQKYPNDPYFGNLWGLWTIGAPTAWETSTGSTNVILAVIDTGVDYTHPDLLPNLWSRGSSFGYNAITGTDDPMDDNYHGTHVAGTIAAVGNNALGVVGVNWTAKVLACKAFGAGGTGYESDIIECLQYIKAKKDAGANIVATNNSYGFVDYFPQALYDAVKDQGDILYIAAAGNSGLNTDRQAAYPANFRLPNVISVAATDSVDRRATFSNFGRYGIHVGAPGVEILSTYPGNNYVYLDGTSMATPHVTGLAGLLKAQRKTRDWRALRNLILTGGDSVPALQEKTITGTRINAAGSMACSGKSVFSAWEIPTSPVVGQAQTVSVINITCDLAAGAVTAQLGNGDSLVLHDDGIGADLAAGDGISSGTWLPTTTSTTMTFTSQSGSFSVSSPPVRINSPTIVAPGLVLEGNATMCGADVGCTMNFSAVGGTTPYAWTAAGSLPPGVFLDNASGGIAGVPTAAGNYRFTVTVNDATGMQDSVDWIITVNEDLRAGWPQHLDNRTAPGASSFSTSPMTADLDGDGRQEIIVVDRSGPGISFTPQDSLYVFAAGGELRAKMLLPGRGSTPAVADIDHDGRPEILLGVGNDYNNNNTVYAFRSDLSLVPNFPAGGYPVSVMHGGVNVHSLVVADLDNNGDPTIISVSSPNNINDPNYDLNIVTLVDGNGRTLSGWPRTAGLYTGNDILPAVADLDGDGRQEFVVTSRDGIAQIFRKDGTVIHTWQFRPASTDWMSAPVIADLNNDGIKEIVLRFVDYTRGGTLVGVYTPSGVLLPNWPQQFANSSDTGVSVADIDSDGYQDVVLVSGAFMNEIHVIDHTGAELPGWPRSNGTATTIGIEPVIADVNDDGSLEILIASNSGSASRNDIEGTVFAYEANGNQLAGFPKLTTPGYQLRSTPVIGDLDGNGRLDLVQKCEDGSLHVWELPTTVSQLVLAWPNRYHDRFHSSATETRMIITTSSSLPEAEVEVPYQVTLTAAFGSPPYSWSVVAGVPPDGLALDSATGVLSGTPVLSQAITFKVHVSDAAGSTALMTFTIVVRPRLAIETTALEDGYTGVPYSQALSATGGSDPYNWSLGADGGLPAGLSLSSDGEISGTPTAAGTSTFTVQVEDARAVVALRSLTIVVSAVVAAGDPWTNLSSASPKNNSATNLSVGSFAVREGMNRLLLVAVVMETGKAANPTISASFGGAALTRIKVTANTQRETVWMGYLTDDQIGSGLSALTISYSGATGNATGLHVKWASFSGVNPTTPVAGSGATGAAQTSATFGSTIPYVYNGLTTVVAGNGGSSAVGQLSAAPAFTAGAATAANAHTSQSFTTARHTEAGSYPSSTAVSWSATTSAWSGLVVVSLQP